MTAPLTQVSLSVEGVPSPLRVIAVEGREALSSLFEFEVTLSADDDLTMEPPQVFDRASIQIEHGDRTRTIQGILRSVEQGELFGTTSSYRAILAPATYVLALREDCRVFQGQSAAQIIESVLTAAGFTGADYRLFLHDTYEPREHATQYRESDWSFLMRLIESEGIFCFFDHEDDHEVLIFADSGFAHRRLREPSAVPFHPAGDALESGERVNRFRHTDELRAQNVALRGHSIRKPGAPLESRIAHKDAAGSAIGIYDAPPSFDAIERGARMSRLRLEQEKTKAGIGNGTSDCLGMAPGMVFTLTEHARDALNRDWLITSTEHSLRGVSESAIRYSNRFTSIPSTTPYRSSAITAKPRVGIQTAVVIGPPGQEVHCDDLGRVKVRFHWERSSDSDDRHSSWIRVSQAWAGPGYGTLFIPRVGHQVLVDFEEGDPDRPIIVGSVYDGLNAPPASLPQQRTTTTFRSSSSPGGDGQSELRFEDQRGREHVYLGSYRDLGIGVGQDKDESVGRNETLQVGGDSEKTIGGSDIELVGATRSITVSGEQTVNVGLAETKTVGGDSSAIVGGDRQLEVGGNQSVDVMGHKTEVIGQSLKVRVGGDRVEKVVGQARTSVDDRASLDARNYAVEVGETMQTTVHGNSLDHADGVKRISAGEIVELVCGEATITAHKDGSVTLVGKNVKVKVAGAVEIEGDRLSVRSHGAVNVSATGSVKVRGRGVNLN